MSDSVFNNFIHHVYAGGSAMGIFDTFDNPIDIVGGADDISVESVFGSGVGKCDEEPLVDNVLREGGEEPLVDDILREGGKQKKDDSDSDSSDSDDDDSLVSTFKLQIKEEKENKPKEESSSLTAPIAIEVKDTKSNKVVGSNSGESKAYRSGSLTPKDIALYLSTYR